MNLSWLLPAGKGIPVLMYHRVWPGVNDALSITPEKLREQWAYLAAEGYKALTLSEYLDMVSGRVQRPGKYVLITFDDGYRNNLGYAYPLLREMGLKATFFIIGNTLDGTAPREEGEYTKMTVAELRGLDAEVVQLAMHGYAHLNFADVSPDEVRAEIVKATAAFDKSGLAYHKVWAYAYGARPGDMAGLHGMMQEAGINAAFRIGNKVGTVPAPDMYELKRIDIKGTDTADAFKIKLRKGRLKPF